MVQVQAIAVPNAAMRIQLGKHRVNSDGKLRADMVGHGRLCSMSVEIFGLTPTKA